MGRDPPQQPGGVTDRAGHGDDSRERVKEQRQTETEQRTQHSTQPLPSPSMSSHSGTPSNPASSSSSSYAPRLVSDGGSSSSPSSAPFQTPDNMSNLDPFSSLSITAIPETDGLLPIVEDPTASNGAPSTPATNPPSRPLPHNLQRLTSESLRPFDASMGDPRGSTVSTPSVASSGRSERRDQLAPLPSQRPTPAERPSLTRSQPSHPRPSPPTPKFTPPARVPLPSPPAMGLSELMSGGSPLATPDNEYGYFSGVHSEPSTLSRSNSNSGSRRTPHYSPFRSYYGPPAGQATPDQLRRSEPQRGSQSGLEWMDRAEPPKAGETASQARPPPHARAATTTAVSLTALTPEVASSSVGSGSQGSRRGSVGSGSTGQGRSPRIQNTGGVLAPHGSFTTARAPKKKKERAPKMAPASDSQLYVGNMRKMDLSEKALAVQAERDALEQAARSGDQLAMYRLGWVAELPRGQRYNIGSIEDVWGPSSPASSGTFRSSFSSRGSIASVSSAGQEHSSSRQGTPTTDLFQTAAGLALRDTAGRNRSNSNFESPASRQWSAEQMSPRP